MTKLLDAAIMKIRERSESDQDEAAEVLFMIANRKKEPVELNPETRAAVLEGLTQAERGEFVPDEEMEAFFKRHGYESPLYASGQARPGCNIQVHRRACACCRSRREAALVLKVAALRDFPSAAPIVDLSDIRELTMTRYPYRIFYRVLDDEVKSCISAMPDDEPGPPNGFDHPSSRGSDSAGTSANAPAAPSSP
jgi:predicted transcriptional regulator